MGATCLVISYDALVRKCDQPPLDLLSGVSDRHKIGDAWSQFALNQPVAIGNNCFDQWNNIVVGLRGHGQMM